MVTRKESTNVPLEDNLSLFDEDAIDKEGK